MFSEGREDQMISTVPAVSEKGSGTRPRVNNADVGSSVEDDSIERPSQLQALLNEAIRATAEGSVTVPDVGAYKLQSSQKPRPMLAVAQMEADLQDFCAGIHNTLAWDGDSVSDDSDMDDGDLVDDFLDRGTGLSPITLQTEEEALSQMRALRTKVSTLPPKERALLLVEKHCGYNHPWWEWRNALIVLWGQLDCGIQILSDARLLKALSQVLGSELINFDPERGQENGYTFAYLTENAGELKAKILEKYSDQRLVLEAIISKKDKATG